MGFNFQQQSNSNDKSLPDASEKEMSCLCYLFKTASPNVKMCGPEV